MRRLCLLLAAATLLAACGDSDAGKGPLSKAEFIERADEICSDFQTAVKDARALTPDTFAELEGQLTTFIEEAEKTLKAFRELEPPTADEDTVSAYEGLGEQNIAVLRKMRDAAEDADQERVRSFQDDLLNIAARQKGIAKTFGFKVCGGGQTA
jgi:hypothetical protein